MSSTTLWQHNSKQQGPQGVQAQFQAKGTAAGTAAAAAADVQAGRLGLLPATVVLVAQVVAQVLLGQCVQ